MARVPWSSRMEGERVFDEEEEGCEEGRWERMRERAFGWRLSTWRV